MNGGTSVISSGYVNTSIMFGDRRDPHFGLYGAVIQKGGVFVGSVHGAGEDGGGSYILEGGELIASMGNINLYHQSGGTATIEVGAPYGRLSMTGGMLSCGDLGSLAEVSISGGVVNAGDVGVDVFITGRSVTVNNVRSARLQVRGGMTRFACKDLSIGESFCLGGTIVVDGSLTADHIFELQASIHLIGSSSVFSAPVDYGPHGELIFEGGNGGWAAFELYSPDTGYNPADFLDPLNFIGFLGQLSVGGTQAANLKLTGSGEALYVHDIYVGPGSTLDLNGSHVYYDGAFVNEGQIIGGYPIPEPATLLLLALGGLVTIRRGRR